MGTSEVCGKKGKRVKNVRGNPGVPLMVVLGGRRWALGYDSMRPATARAGNVGDLEGFPAALF